MKAAHFLIAALVVTLSALIALADWLGLVMEGFNMKKKRRDPIPAQWRIHTPALLKEVLANPQAQILSVPLNILGKLLYRVGERAAELNDPELNALMCRLTIYEEADPYSKDHNPELVRKTIAKAKLS